MDRLTTLLLLHFVAQGLQILVNQIVARRRYDPLFYTYCVAVTTCLTLVPGLVFWARSAYALRHDGLPGPRRLVIYGLVFLALGGAYSATTYARLKAQTVLPTYVFAPLSRMSLLIVVIVSVVYLNEQRSWLELLAIGAMFIPLTVLRPSQDPESESVLYGVGIVWTLLAVGCASGLQIASKLAVDPQFGFGVPVILFVCGVNAGNMVISAAGRLFVSRCVEQPGPTIVWGILGGMLNVGSFMTLTLFLVAGDASRIYPISSLSLVLPVFVLAILGKEKRPTTMQFVGLLLSLAGIYVLVK